MADDVADCVADAFDPLSLFIRDSDAELLFNLQDQLDDIQ